MHQFALLFQRQNATVVGQRVDHHRGVMARLDHFVQIADRTMPRGNSQRAVLPLGALGGKEKAADQVGGRHVLVAGNGDQGLAQSVRHVFDETGLAAAGRPLEHHRHAHGVGGLEQFHLVGDGAIVGLLGYAILIDDTAQEGLLDENADLSTNGANSTAHDSSANSWKTKSPRLRLPRSGG